MSESTNGDSPAFPVPNDANVNGQMGLSKREWLIGHVLSGLCANPAVIAPNGMSGWSLVNCSESQLGEYAAHLADKAIAAMEKGIP